MVSGVTADYYYGDSSESDLSITGDTGFSVPQYNSNREILTKLAAPFIFVTILMKIAYGRALRFAFADSSKNRSLLNLVENNRPDLSREATVMSLATAGLLIPTPFWDYVVYAVGTMFAGILTIGVIAVLAIIYLFLKGISRM